MPSQPSGAKPFAYTLSFAVIELLYVLERQQVFWPRYTVYSEITAENRGISKEYMTSLMEYTSYFIFIQQRYLHFKTTRQFPSQKFPKSIFKISTGITIHFESRIFLVFISKSKSTILHNKIKESGKPWFLGSIFGIFQLKFHKDIAVLGQKNAKNKRAKLV